MVLEVNPCVDTLLQGQEPGCIIVKTLDSASLLRRVPFCLQSAEAVPQRVVKRGYQNVVCRVEVHMVAERAVGRRSHVFVSAGSALGHMDGRVKALEHCRARVVLLL